MLDLLLPCAMEADDLCPPLERDLALLHSVSVLFLRALRLRERWASRKLILFMSRLRREVLDLATLRSSAKVLDSLKEHSFLGVLRLDLLLERPNDL